MKKVPKISHGALLGWKTEVTGDRVILKIQSTQKASPLSREDIDELILMLDTNQAVQLGTNLFEMTKQSSPWSERKQKKPLIERLLRV